MTSLEWSLALSPSAQAASTAPSPSLSTAPDVDHLPIAIIHGGEFAADAVGSTPAAASS